MKKSLYLCLCASLLICAVDVNAQYHITLAVRQATFPVYWSCNDSVNYYITTNAYSAGLSIITYDGHGMSTTSPVNNGGGYGYAYQYSLYESAGTYSEKHVLLNGTARVDSVITKNEFIYCNTVILKCFNDVLGTGIYDSSADQFMTIPIKLQVSVNGVISDTITILSGFNYPIYGILGDIFSFKMISNPVGMSLTCPTGGVIYDTVKATGKTFTTKYFGLKCTGAIGFDLAVNAIIPITGISDQSGDIYVSNFSCNPTNATVILNFSPKYSYCYALPTPSSVSGNTITWNLIGVSTTLVKLCYFVVDNKGLLKVGDTVNETIKVTPTTGDSDPSNNIEFISDAVRAGCDPNEMWVSPAGYIPSGTNIKYTINFENTGNDTAFNISVYDTLSPFLDPTSIDIVMASGVMNITQYNQDGYNVVKFDFPNINLLDSSHHGQCDGAVIFTINTKQGLANGTKIDNRAGIYFDYNDVVMTNTVENIIGVPSGVATIGNSSKVKLYPNPVSDELTINMDNGRYSTMSITNTIGQVMMTQSLNTLLTKVNVQALPGGIYFLTLRGESGVKVMKFEKL